MEVNEFDESSYYSEYKQIRNKFRAFDKALLLREILEFLYENYSAESDKQLQKLPWAQLLLIKWILLDENINYRINKKPTRTDVTNLANRMNGIQSHCRMPSDYQNFHIFMRNMAFQQFHYQTNFNPIHLGRQIHLFTENTDYSIFDNEFSQSYGISIIKFIEISSCIFSVFSGKNTTVSLRQESFSPVIKYFTEESITKYLAAISLDMPSLINYLKNIPNNNRSSREYFEQSPLLKFPFLKEGENYSCWYPTVFFRCAEHFVYDRLRDIDKPKFMNRFGSLFERYVEKLILHSGEKYLTEENIGSCISGKIVDFIIHDEGSLFYVDAKAVETVRTIRNSNDPTIIRQRINDSIISAIDQAHNVHCNIKPILEKYNIKVDDRFDSYILVITYKEMYVGNGETLYDVYAKDKINEIYSRYPNNIPVENMYFLTIEEFEVLCELVRASAMSISSYIKKAIASDSDPSTKKYDFMLHIREWGGNKPPSFIHESYLKVFDRLMAAFDTNN